MVIKIYEQILVYNILKINLKKSHLKVIYIKLLLQLLFSDK
jgi:hypothetical protein